MPEQLAFSLPARAALGRHDFLVAEPNAAALAIIDDWKNWPLRKLVLTGPPAAGKTHLAHVWASMTAARILDFDEISDLLEAPMEAGACLVVEDVDRITDPAHELQLLGLHNLLQEIGGWLLVTARRPVSEWSLGLPDLKSRMQAASMARLDDPDDGLLAGVILKLFDDRQLQVTPDVVAYVVQRIERSFEGAQAAVQAIDDAALAEKRAITRPFVGEILEKSGKSTFEPPS